MSFIEFSSVLLSLDTISRHGHVLNGCGPVLTTALVAYVLHIFVFMAIAIAIAISFLLI